MKIKNFKVYGNGKHNIFVMFPFIVTEELEEIFTEMDVAVYVSEELYDNLLSSIPEKFTINGKIRPFSSLDKALQNEDYIDTMNNLMDFISKYKIKHAFVNANMVHPQYLTILKAKRVQTITKLTDDPQGSKYYSKDSVKYYDKVVCSGIDYDSEFTIEEMFKKWGAENVRFIPVFIEPSHYDANMIDYDAKDIDLVYVGALQIAKWRRLHILHKKFDIKLYGRYDPRKQKSLLGLFYNLYNLIFPLPKVVNVSDSELKEIYKRTRIGINMSFSDKPNGPSNARSYELCLNGVLQITDNKKGYAKLYDVGKEIVCYDNFRNACFLIDKYLSYKYSDGEDIAEAGHQKALQEYTYENIWIKHLAYILEGKV